MISKLTEEQRAEIRNARGAEVDSRGSRKRKREERKRLREKAAMHGLGRDGKQKQFSRGVKKPTPRRQARHYGITFALEPGDLAATSRELWLATVTCDDDRSSSMIRRTIPAGSLVIIDSLCGTTSAYDRNHCRVFFEGLVWDRCPVATLRPLHEDDDDDDEDDEE